MVIKINTENLTYAQVQEHIKQLQEREKQLREEALTDVREEAAKLFEKRGFTVEEVYPELAKKTATGSGTKKQSSEATTRTVKWFANPLNLKDIYRGGNPNHLDWRENVVNLIAEEEGIEPTDISWGKVKEYLVELDPETGEPLNETERAKIRS